MRDACQVGAIALTALLLVSSCRTAQPADQAPAPPQLSEATPSTGPKPREAFTEPELRDAPTLAVREGVEMTFGSRPAETAQTFGEDDSLGFLLWVSAQDTLAVVMLAEDRDGDGAITLEFGPHGETLGDGFAPHLVDLRDGSMRRYDELMSWDRDRRYVALRDGPGGALDVWDAETFEQVRIDASWGWQLAPDGNRCLRPRALYISPGGVLWGVSLDGQSALQRPFGEDEAMQGSMSPALQREIQMWRVESAGGEAVSLFYVDRAEARAAKIALPTQRTSCACRFCDRFAPSHGHHGWEGPGWMTRSVQAEVGFSQESRDVLRMVTPQLVADASSGELRARNPKELHQVAALPRGCAVAPWSLGIAPHALINCEGAPSALFDGQHLTELPVALVAAPPQPPAVSEAGSRWVVAVAEVEGGEYAVARARLEDGHVELGAERYAETPELELIAPGMFLARGSSSAELIEASSGERTTARESPELLTRPTPLLAIEDALTSPMPPDAMRGSARCGVVARQVDERLVEHGPWRLICAVETPRDRSAQLKKVSL